MSRENVEIVRAGFEAWNAGDADAIRAALDRDVILRPPEDWPEPGPYLGRRRLCASGRKSARRGTPTPSN